VQESVFGFIILNNQRFLSFGTFYQEPIIVPKDGIGIKFIAFRPYGMVQRPNLIDVRKLNIMVKPYVKVSSFHVWLV